jgi:hypothetical protein
MNIFNIQETFAQKAIEYAPQFGLPGLPATTTPTIFKFIFGLGIVATVVSLIISGILYIFAGPAPSLVAKAKKRVLMSLIGLIILLLSNFIFNQINEELTMPKIKLVQISELSQAPGINLPENEVELLKLKIMLLYLLALKQGDVISINIESSGGYSIEDELIKGTLAKAAVDLNTTTNAILDCIEKDYSGCDSKIKEKLKVNFFILLMAKFFANLEKDFRKEIADVDIDKLISNISSADENNYNTFISTLDSALGIGGQDKYSFVQRVGYQILVEPDGYLKLYIVEPSSGVIISKITGRSYVYISWEEAFEKTFSKKFFDSQKNKKLYESIVYDGARLTKIKIGLPKFSFQSLTFIKDLKYKIKYNVVSISSDNEAILLHKNFENPLVDSVNSHKSDYTSAVPLKIHITEAFPPGHIHIDKNHYNGMAIDISLRKVSEGTISTQYENYVTNFVVYITKIADNPNIKDFVIEYEEGDVVYSCLSKLKGVNLKSGVKLEDLRNNNYSLNNNFCECDKVNLNNRTYCSFVEKFIFYLISDSSGGQSILFKNYPTTKGNPIHIEVR